MGASVNTREIIMSTLTNWFNMGGYAGYVWPAYGAVLFVFVGHVLYAKQQKKRVLRDLKRWSKHL